MKTRFTLTSLALASLMMMGNAAMAAVVPSGTSQFFNMKIKIVGSCEVFTTTNGKEGAISTAEDLASGTDIDFGEKKAEKDSPAIVQSNAGGAVQGITVHCSKNTGFKIAMEPESSHSKDGSGSMTGLASQEKISYQLYKPTVTGNKLDEVLGANASENKWGREDDSLSLTGKGLNTAINIPVFAKIEQGVLTDKTPDTYQDRVKVTLTY